MSNKHMTIEEFLERFFTTGSAPSVYTVRNWIIKGKIDGVKIGGAYFIPENNPFSLTPVQKLKNTTNISNQPYQPQKEFDPTIFDDPVMCARVNKILMSK